eukprot:18044-Heterococcus_DN1.PRE.1
MGSLLSGAEFLPEGVLNKFYSIKPFALTHKQRFLKEQCESSCDEAPHSTACEPHAREHRANTGNNSSHNHSSGFSSSTFCNSSFANRGREVLAALQSKNTRANCSNSSESTCSKLRVSITDTTTHGEGLQAHTVYIIFVKDESSGLEWHTHRRYSQFERLNNQIVLLHPDAVLPKKELFSRHRGVVELRIQALNEYLQQLLRAPQIRNHEALRSFLEVSPLQRGACAFSRAFGADCILRCGFLRAKQWNGPPKDVVSILDCALGWVDAYTVVQPGPVIHFLHGPESDPLRHASTIAAACAANIAANMLDREHLEQIARNANRIHVTLHVLKMSNIANYTYRQHPIWRLGEGASQPIT